RAGARECRHPLRHQRARPEGLALPDQDADRVARLRAHDVALAPPARVRRRVRRPAPARCPARHLPPERRPLLVARDRSGSARARASAATLFATNARVRRVWRFLTRMPIAWLVYALTMWLWHLPPAYDAAFADPLLHDVQHVTFLLSAVLFWWPVIDPAPRGC